MLHYASQAYAWCECTLKAEASLKHECCHQQVCPLLVIFHHFGDFGLSDGDQMVRENNGDFGVIFVFLGNLKKKLFKLLKFKVEILIYKILINQTWQPMG